MFILWSLDWTRMKTGKNWILQTTLCSNLILYLAQILMEKNCGKIWESWLWKPRQVLTLGPLPRFYFFLDSISFWIEVQAITILIMILFKLCWPAICNSYRSKSDGENCGLQHDQSVQFISIKRLLSVTTLNRRRSQKFIAILEHYASFAVNFNAWLTLFIGMACFVARIVSSCSSNGRTVTAKVTDNS